MDYQSHWLGCCNARYGVLVQMAGVVGLSWKCLDATTSTGVLAAFFCPSLQDVTMSNVNVLYPKILS